MKYISLSLLLSIACVSSLNAMETDSNNNNDDTITFLSPEQILEQPDVLFEQDRDHFAQDKEYFDRINSHTQTCKWITQKQKALEAPSAPYFYDAHTNWQVHTQTTPIVMFPCGNSLSKHNYIFDTGHGTIVRVAGDTNTLHSRASSAGIDSGPAQNMYDFDENGYPKYKADVLQRATSNTKPVFQHTSMIAYYLIMKKQLEGKKVQPVQTWLAKRDTTWMEGTPEDLACQEFNDHNYVIVQPKNPESYKRLDTLDPTEFNTVVSKDLLPDLAKAVESGGWGLNSENLFYDTGTKTFYITDLEKPNNEGWGPNPGTNPRWGTAVLSLKGDGTSSHPWKWDHNIRCGYEAIKTGLLAHAVNKQELVKEWDALKATRAPKE